MTTVAHHFDDLQQQREALRFGMWVFLLTEVMLFGGLFTAYTVYRLQYPAAFAEASRHLDVWLGTINTAVLIASSLAVALAHRSAELENRRSLIVALLAAIVLGSVFVGIKSFEYYHKSIEGLVPGEGFHYAGSGAREVQLFFVLYFVMTGLHLAHMLIGLAVLLGIVLLAMKQTAAEQQSRVEVAGLYWHFVDIVWIFLFPLLYLIGLH